MNGNVNIIILENIPTDAELFELQIRKSNIPCTLKRAATKDQFIKLLGEFMPDLVIADVSMPRLAPCAAMELAREVTPGIPWLLVGPAANEEMIAECFHAGAADFVSKKMYTRLGAAVKRVLESPAVRPAEPNVQQSAKKEHPFLNPILESITDLVAVVNLEGRRLYNSPSYMDLLEDPEELRGTDSFMDIHPEDRDKVKHAFHEVVTTGYGKRLEYRLMDREGAVRHIESQSNLMMDGEGRPLAVVIVSRDISARKKADESLYALVAETAVRGDEYFQALVRHLAGYLGVRYALVSACTDAKKERVHALAYWADGKAVPPFEYDVAGTTCEQVIKNTRMCYFPANVQELFPRETALVTMKAHCYLGIPLCIDSGALVGHMFIMDDKPLPDAARAIHIMNAFAPRTAGELQRRLGLPTA